MEEDNPDIRAHFNLLERVQKNAFDGYLHEIIQFFDFLFSFYFKDLFINSWQIKAIRDTLESIIFLKIILIWSNTEDF